MKNIYLIIVLLFSNLISAQELVEDLEKSANSVLDLDKTKKKEVVREVNPSNVMNLSEEEFKIVRETFLKNFGECTPNVQVFKMANGEKGRIGVRGFVKLKNHQGIEETFCQVSLKVRPDFSEFCSYPEDRIVQLYGYFAYDFFEEGIEDSRYGLEYCRRFY